MTYGEDDAEGSKSRWVNDIHEARRDAIEVRREIPQHMNRCQPWNVPDLVDYYNRLLHEYASGVRPKSDLLADYWEKEFTTVHVPEDGQTVHVDGSDVNVHGELTVDPSARLTTQPRRVALDELETWRRDNLVRYTVERQGSGHELRRGRLLLALPPYAVDQCIDQLNKCLDDLGWLPDAAVKEYRETEALQVR